MDRKLERLSALEADNVELQSINESLLQELEKRDQAIKEAVELICELEEEMDTAESPKDGREQHIESVAHSPAPIKPKGIPSSPPLRSMNTVSAPPAPNVEDERDEVANLPNTGSLVKNASTTESAKPPPRMPSFIWDKKRSTRALRGLYMHNESFSSSLSLPRTASVFQKDDIEEDADTDNYMVTSPRLSVLSESSFMSVYGQRKESDQASNEHDMDIEQPEYRSSQHANPAPHQRGPRQGHRTDERTRPSTPSRKSKIRGQRDSFTSIGEVLHKAPSRQQLEHQRSIDQDYDDMPLYNHDHKLPKIPSLSGPIFGGDVLPPTPDTMSTHRKDANSSTPSIVTEKSLLDGTPYPAKTLSALVPQNGSCMSDEGAAFNMEFNTDPDFAYSEDDPESVQVEQSESGAFESPQHYSQPSTFMGGASRASRVTGMTLPTRPPLSTYATDMMFNGEGYDAVQSSQRTVSYPSPSPRTRRHSNQAPPLAYDAASARSTRLSPDNNMGGGSNTVTPTQSSHTDRHSRSPSLQRTTSSTASQRSAHEPPLNPSSNPSSTSSRMLPPTPTTSGPTSLASRIFRRPSKKEKPGTFEHPASNHPARALASTFGNARPLSSAFQSNVPQPPSRIARPGTAGSQSQSSSNSVAGRRSAIFDDIVTLGNESQGKDPAAELGRSTSLRSKMGLGWRRGKGE